MMDGTGISGSFRALQNAETARSYSYDWRRQSVLQKDWLWKRDSLVLLEEEIKEYIVKMENNISWHNG